MQFLYIFSVLLAIFVRVFSADQCKGCVNLDEYNFEKIIGMFKAVLVKFDVPFPYGDKHDEFIKFAEEIVDNDDIIVAQVGIKDYGDKDNEHLAKMYDIKKTDFPVVKLFRGNVNDHLTFKDEFIVHNLRHFVLDNAGIYVRLPGCIQKYDGFARDFMKSTAKAETLERIREHTEIGKDEEATVKTYLLFMEKIVENGVDFVKSEKHRLNKLIKEGKVNQKKKHELTQRLNILYAFKVESEPEPKDEL